MTRLTEENIGDQLSPDTRVERESVEAANNALHRIKKYSGETRRAIHSSLLRPRLLTLQAPELRRARKLKSEARRQIEDVPEQYRTGFEKDTGYNRAVRLSVSEEALTKDRKETTYLPADRFVINGMKGKDSAGNDVDIVVEIDHTVSPWKDRLLTEDEVASLIKSKGKGVEISGENFVSVDDTQKHVIAKKYFSQMTAYQNLGKVFASNGTSELNIQTATMFARQNPDAVVAALSSSKEEAQKEVDKTRAQQYLLHAIDELSKFNHEKQAFSFDDIDAEKVEIKKDINEINKGVAMTSADSKVGKDLLGRGYVVPADSREMKKIMNDHLDKLENSEKYYSKIRSAIKRIYQLSKDAKIAIPSELGTFFDSSGNFDDSALKPELDPKILSDSLRKEFKLKSVEEIKIDIETKEKALSDIESGSLTPTGPEAIMRTYQLHFEKNGMAPTEAKRAAAHLYGRNAIGRKEWQVAKQTLSGQDVMGNEQRIYQWPGQQLKELAQGSQESFICHIAESPAIGLQHSVTNRLYGFNLLDDTRRAGLLWRKHNARPAWGAMSYGQLLTSYYAIRSALKAGDINNTPYVRGTMDEITRLLLDKFSEEIAEDMHMSEESDEEKKDMQTVPQQEYLRENIVEMLAGEAPPEYASSASAALSYSRQETGRRRKAIGRAIARVTGFGTTYGVKKPFAAAKWTVTAPFRWMKAGAQKVWEKGNQKSKFFS